MTFVWLLVVVVVVVVVVVEESSRGMVLWAVPLARFLAFFLFSPHIGYHPLLYPPPPCIIASW